MPDPTKPPVDPTQNPTKLRRIFASLSQRFYRHLEWIGRHVDVVLLVNLSVVLAIWMFVFVAHKVNAGTTLSFDNWALEALRKPNDPEDRPIGPSWMAEVGRDLTALGGVAVLTLLTFAVAGFLWLRRMYAAMTLVLASTLGGLIMSTLLKSLFDRPRPDVVKHLSLVYTSSFPSGHSMLSATVYLTLGALLARFVSERILQAYFVLTALALTFLVGISRVYMGVHYPTDVLAGWCAGLAWALLCWRIARTLQHRGKIEAAQNN